MIFVRASELIKSTRTNFFVFGGQPFHLFCWIFYGVQKMLKKCFSYSLLFCGRGSTQNCKAQPLPFPTCFVECNQERFEGAICFYIAWLFFREATCICKDNIVQLVL